jgi:hypothetical protein
MYTKVQVKPMNLQNSRRGPVTSATRMELAVSAAAPNPVYAALITVTFNAKGVATSGSLTGIYRLDPKTQTWTAMTPPLPTTTDGGVTNPLFPGMQGYLHFAMAADPNDPNVVFVSCDRQPMTSGNAEGLNDFTGRTFRGVFSTSGSRFYFADGTALDGTGADGTGANGTSPHADARAMVFDSNGSNANILEADDGGIYRLTSPDNAATRAWSSLNGNLADTELYSVAYDSLNNIIIGGAQDVGFSFQNTAGFPTWDTVKVGGINWEGDGQIAAVDTTSAPGFALRYGSASSLFDFGYVTYDNTNSVITNPITSTNPIDQTQTTVQPFQLSTLLVGGLPPKRTATGAFLGNGDAICSVENLGCESQNRASA